MSSDYLPVLSCLFNLADIEGSLTFNDVEFTSESDNPNQNGDVDTDDGSIEGTVRACKKM